jgi:uncharacterized membrane protein
VIIEDEFVIDHPVDSVFSHMAVELRPQWVRGAVEHEKITEGPVGKGTKFRAVQEFGGRRLEGIDEITVYEPNRVLSESWGGPFPGNSEMRFSDENGSTRVHRHIEIKPSGLFSLLAPLMKPLVKRELNRDLKRFREWIASDAS